MGWLSKFLYTEEGTIKSTGYETDGKSTTEIRGKNKRKYAFDYHYTIWINGITVKQRIKGLLDKGVLAKNSITGEQVWNIKFHDLEFQWNEHCAPEIYLMFDLIRRFTITLDRGRIVAYDIPTTLKENWQKKWQEIQERIPDKLRALEFYGFITEQINNKDFIKALLQDNAVLKCFFETDMLVKTIKNKPVETFFPDTIVQEDYFGKGIHLPIKYCKLFPPNKFINDEQIELILIGGLDKDKFNKQLVQESLRMLTGVCHLNVEVKTEYSHYYKIKKNYDPLNGLDIIYAEQLLETIVNEGWYKEERIEIELKEND